MPDVGQPGAGTTSSPYFYRNPQYYFMVDSSKPDTPSKVETLVTYKSSAGSDVKLYLCNGSTKNRITHITDDNIVDKS